MNDEPTEAERIAYLEERIAALEEQLRRRSSELRLIQRHVCARDLAIIARVMAGLSPEALRSPFHPEGWRNDVELSQVDVDAVLVALWQTDAPDEAAADV